MAMWLSDAEKKNRSRPFTREVEEPIREETKEELQKKWQREFLMEDKEILEKLDNGYNIYQRYITPLATWLHCPGESDSPNITARSFKGLRDNGYIEELEEHKPTHSVKWGITEHGQTYLDKLNGVVLPMSSEPEEEEVLVEEDKAKYFTRPPEERVCHHDFSSCGNATVIRTHGDRYMMMVESADYVTLVAAAKLLNLNIVAPWESVATPVEESRKVVAETREGLFEKCDYCEEDYEVKKRMPAWRHKCSGCINSYQNEKKVFIRKFGRTPKKSDR